MITPINPDIKIEIPMLTYVSNDVYKHVLDNFVMKLPEDPSVPSGISFAIRFLYNRTIQKNEIECHIINTLINVIESNLKEKYQQPEPEIVDFL